MRTPQQLTAYYILSNLDYTVFLESSTLGIYGKVTAPTINKKITLKWPINVKTNGALLKATR